MYRYSVVGAQNNEVKRISDLGREASCPGSSGTDGDCSFSKHFRYYLLDDKYRMRTDHHSLNW